MSDERCEYLIKQRSTAKKIIFISIYILIFAVPTAISFLEASANSFIPIILISLFLSLLTAFITWRFANIEFEFVIEGGEFKISKIYGKSIKKTLLIIPISSFVEIGTYGEEEYEQLSKLSLQKNLICVSSLDAEEMYYAIYSEGEDKCIIYFEATQKALEILRRYNSSAFKTIKNRK